MTGGSAGERAERVRPRHDDAGSALVEFVGASVVLLVPMVYLLLTVFTVQRAAFGVDEAAREAGLALALAGSTPVGIAQADYAARLALDDQGVRTPPQVRYLPDGTPCPSPGAGVVPVLTPGSRYLVCVTERVALPFTGDGLLGRIAPASMTVVGRYLVVVDLFRPAR